MTADIRLAVSVIQTVFAQNHRAAATAADDHANTPNNKKNPSPAIAERGATSYGLSGSLTAVKSDTKFC